MNKLYKFLGNHSTSRHIISYGLNLSRPRTQSSLHRFYSDEKKPKNVNSLQNDTNPIVGSRFEKYTEENATIILDVEEERERIKQGYVNEEFIPKSTGLDLFEGMNLSRGKRGVFEIEDLVEVLRRDNVDDIFVCKVPEELKYVDYLCVITGRSTRHMKAIIEFILKLYKLKCADKDRVPRVEGKGSNEWIALDLGNIALHVFSDEARSKYDLETLWSARPKFDRETNKPSDPLLEMFERSMYLNDLTPANEEQIPIQNDIESYKT